MLLLQMQETAFFSRPTSYSHPLQLALVYTLRVLGLLPTWHDTADALPKVTGQAFRTHLEVGVGASWREMLWLKAV